MLFAPVVIFVAPYYISGLGASYFIDFVFACFLIAVTALDLPNEFFSQFDKLGSISFGIYSLHWPIFCSFGLWFILSVKDYAAGWVAYILSIVLCSITSIGLSVVFNISIEKWSSIACKKIDEALRISAPI